jgi:hypothetical protein
MLDLKQSVKSDSDPNPEIQIQKKIISNSQHCRKKEFFSKEQKRITGTLKYRFAPMFPGSLWARLQESLLPARGQTHRLRLLCPGTVPALEKECLMNWF